jgi:hypothetical protein
MQANDAQPHLPCPTASPTTTRYAGTYKSYLYVDVDRLRQSNVTWPRLFVDQGSSRSSAALSVLNSSTLLRLLKHSASKVSRWVGVVVGAST